VDLIGLSLCKTRQEKKSNNLTFCSKAPAYTYFIEIPTVKLRVLKRRVLMHVLGFTAYTKSASLYLLPFRSKAQAHTYFTERYPVDLIGQQFAFLIKSASLHLFPGDSD
jgi:hypothetical protein